MKQFNDIFKIIQIHSDYKFISDGARFIGPEIENKIVIIEKNDSYKGELKENYNVCKVSEFEKVLRICQGADLVVLYNLDIFKAKIVLALPKDIKISWRFFGYELYGKKISVFLSDETKRYFPQKSYTQKVESILRIPFRVFKIGAISYSALFFKAVNRINFMLVLSKEEYNMLSNLYKLPTFMRMAPKGWHPIISAKQLESKKDKNIIIGHSRSIFLNHIDTIRDIDKCPNKDNYNFKIMFNYGPENDYTQAVRQLTKNKPYYQLIETFMPRKEYELFYQSISALVINSYRQLAGANIFIGFQYGVKVYLNPQNVHMQWLQNLGFKVFPIEELKYDIENNNVSLSEEEIQYNFDMLEKYNNSYTQEEFIQEIKRQIKCS